jgi:hypothetical protein
VVLAITIALLEALFMDTEPARPAAAGAPPR